MASSDLIKYGLLAAAGWFAWSKLSESSALPPPPATTPPATTPPATTTTPPVVTLEQRLLTAAGVPASTVQGPDQWAYFWAGLKDANGVAKGALPSTALDVWFPAGRPEDQSQYPQITAAQFVSGLATKGISGLSGYRLIRLPLMQPYPFIGNRRQQRIA